MDTRGYRPRWVVAIAFVTMPIWIVPALLWVGWMEAGRDLVKQIGPGLRWIFLGK